VADALIYADKDGRNADTLLDEAAKAGMAVARISCFARAHALSG
jgi:hypothetical protein